MNLRVVAALVLFVSSAKCTAEENQTLARNGAFSEPLSLQFSVLDVTDGLRREMQSAKWQAMLRALGGDREILKRFAHLRPRFASLERQLTQGQALEIFTHLGKINSKWFESLNRLENLTQPINSLYEWFDRYQRNAGIVNERTLSDYADTVHADDEVGTGKILDSLHQLVCPEAANEATGVSRADRVTDCRGGIFDTLASSLTKASDSLLCSSNKSPHQTVYDLYTLLALTDAKGYAMMQFSWILLRMYGKGNFTLESEIARADFERRVTEKAQTARRVLSSLSTWMWRCDAAQSDQKEGDTFLRFTEVLQGYLVNEVDLNSYNTCKESCSAYTSAQELSCYANQFCSKQKPCRKGKVYNCGFIEADSSVCSTSEPGRRYDWIEYKSGRLLGRKSDCKARGQNLTRADSWWRWLFWHCSYCVCLCDQPSPSSDRYVSLQTVTADVNHNYLVTGVRLVKEGRVVHLQIQEGVAMPRGTINASSVQWKPVDPIKIAENTETDEDGPNYATLRFDERAIDLDDITAPPDHVITGIRFRKLGGHLNLEIQASPIDFTTGQIVSSKAIWLSNDNTPASEGQPRSKLNLVSPDVPTRSNTPSLPDSRHDQYVEFQASSLEKDVSQTTVPFLDAQPVVPQPPIWLTGVGIYHKGQPGYGGYVALRVSTLNVSDYLLMPNGNFNFTSGEA